jgi:hypothetical protein
MCRIKRLNGSKPGVQPANWDGQMPWTMVIFPAGTQTNDAQLSSGDVVVTEAGTLKDSITACLKRRPCRYLTWHYQNRVTA